MLALVEPMADSNSTGPSWGEVAHRVSHVPGPSITIRYHAPCPTVDEHGNEVIYFIKEQIGKVTVGAEQRSAGSSFARFVPMVATERKFVASTCKMKDYSSIFSGRRMITWRLISKQGFVRLGQSMRLAWRRSSYSAWTG